MEKEDIEEKNEQIVSSKKLFILLKELAQTQLDKGLVEAAEFKNNTNEKIAKKTNELKNYIRAQAKRYGQNEKEVNEVMEKFDGFIKDAKRKYKDARAGLVEEKNNLEERETEKVTAYDEAKADFKDMPGYRAYAKRKAEVRQAKKSGDKKEYEQKKAEFESYKKGLPERVAMLKADIQRDMDSGNIADAKGKMAKLEKLQKQADLAAKDDELRQMRDEIKGTREELEQKKAEIEGCDITFEETVDKINDLRETRLAKVDKQNIFQKMVAMAYNRLGGAKKFAKRVKEPIEASMLKFKNETVPNMIKRVSKGARDIKEGIGNNISAMARGAKKKKDNIIEGAINKLQGRIDRNNERINEFHKRNPGYDIGRGNPADKYKDGMFKSGDDVKRDEKIDVTRNDDMEMVD